MDKPRGKSIAPGARALVASGDGFWEINLSDGTTWFSDWFYARLGWPADPAPTAWSALRAGLLPGAWEMLLRDMRLHLEKHAPMNVEIPVRLADGSEQFWQFRGSAQRNDYRQPIYLAGTVRDVTAARAEREARVREAALLHQAFDSLYQAIAMLDDAGVIVAANRRWRECTSAGALCGTRFAVGANYFEVGADNPAAAELRAVLERPPSDAKIDFSTTYAAGHQRRHLRAVVLECERVRRLLLTDEELAS